MHKLLFIYLLARGASKKNEKRKEKGQTQTLQTQPQTKWSYNIK